MIVHETPPIDCAPETTQAAMHPILTGLTIVLIFAGAFTARDSVRHETILISSLGLILIGIAVRQRFKR